MEEIKKLSVVYSTDDNYAKYMGISMLSLLKSNTGFEEIEVHVLDCGIQEENRRKLQEIAAEWKREIFFYPMQEAIDSLNLNQGAHKLAAASYARLFLGTILPERCQRVLYLDCDTIVQDSLKKLWNVPMDHALIAGVQDTVDKFFLKVIHLPENTRYVNAGVLLVNLKAWREENVQQKFMDVIARFHGNVPHHDQGTINAVCRGRKIYLPVRYNMISNLYSFPARTIRRMYFMDRYYSQKEIDRAKQHPAIVHFTTGLVGRPWEENCTHPERDSFWETVKASPWSDMGMQPDRRKKSLKAFTFVYHHMPRSMFEVLYRSMSWALHLRK